MNIVKAGTWFILGGLYALNWMGVCLYKVGPCMAIAFISSVVIVCAILGFLGSQWNCPDFLCTKKPKQEEK